MKKLLAMFLAFFLVVPTTSYAFDDEVTFLGMRFGQATPEQAVEALVSNGYKYGNIRVEADTSIWTLYSDDESAVYPYADTGSNPGGIGIDYYFGRGSEIKVAGHPIFSQDLYFLYDVVDGQINKDKATFVKASYRFQSLEQHALYNDLLSKLTKLYGEPELYEHKQEYINSNTKIISVATWKGLNDTAIVLSMEWRTVDGAIKIPTDYIGDDWVNLKYGLIDTSEKMIEIKAIYDKLALEAEKQRIEDNKDDTGGL